LSNFWTKIETGINVEVQNRHSDDLYAGKSYWFATIIKLAGYLAKLRYIGCDNDDSYDFWINICDESIHSVGWSAENEVALIPPQEIRDKVDNWKDYLINKLNCSKTLPKSFRRRIQDSLRSKFKCGMLLELIDKKRISRMKVARIIENVGGRLRMKYEDCEDFEDFWCHQNSELIHPIGWSVLNGHQIDAPESKECIIRFIFKLYQEVLFCNPTKGYKQSSFQKIINSSYEPNECVPSTFKNAST
jgi:hypothetical protein